MVLVIFSTAVSLYEFGFQSNEVKHETTGEGYFHQIPLRRAGNLLLLDATVDTITGAFVFDTGARGLVLNSTYFRQAKNSISGSGSGVTGGQIQRMTLKVKNFTFHGVEYKNQMADVIDLSHIENSKGTKILGLIGTKLIKDYEIIIDVKNQSMALHSIDRKGRRTNGIIDSNHYCYHQKIQLIDNTIITHLREGKKKICFCIDTGAEHTVIDYACPDDLTQRIQIQRRSILRGSGNQKREVLYGLLDSLNFSDHSIAQMPVILTDLSHMRKGYGINIMGMLGFSIFEQGIVRINLKQKKLSVAAYRKEDI